VGAPGRHDQRDHRQGRLLLRRGSTGRENTGRRRGRRSRSGRSDGWVSRAANPPRRPTLRGRARREGRRRAKSRGWKARACEGRRGKQREGRGRAKGKTWQVIQKRFGSIANSHSCGRSAGPSTPPTRRRRRNRSRRTHALRLFRPPGEPVPGTGKGILRPAVRVFRPVERAERVNRTG